MIELLVETTRQALTPTVQERLTRRATSLFAASGCDPEAEVSVVLVDDAAIRALNLEWRGVDDPTDVLSFALSEAEDAHLHPGLLGDIVISVDTAERQSSRAGHALRVHEPADAGMLDAATWTLEDELLFLLVHGFLHLLGHDHAEPDEEARMRAEERRLYHIARAVP